MGKEKKKHKKKSHEHKKRHKKKSKHQSSSDDGSSSDEWVELESAPSSSKLQASPPQRSAAETASEHDEWLSNPALLACSSRDQLRQAKEKKNEKKDQDKYMLDNLGRTDRELNPYWADGGSGLPEERAATVESLRQAEATVGDQGAAWLRKALQRAREQAQDSGRPLEEVVAERWGSLSKLESMIAAAEERDKNKKYNVRVTKDNPRYSKRDEFRDKTTRPSFKERGRDRDERNNKPHRESQSKKSFSKPRDSSDDSSGNEKTSRFKRQSGRMKESLHSDRDETNRSKERKQVMEQRSKRSKDSSEVSNSSSEEEKNHHIKQKNKEKMQKKFSKPRSESSDSSRSSSSVERNRKSSRRYKEHERDRRSESSVRKFSKPAHSSDEDQNSFREKRGDFRDKDKYIDRNQSYDYKKKFVRPRRDSEEDNNKPKSYESKSKDYKSFSSRSGGWRKKVESQKKDEEAIVENKVEKTEGIEKDSESEIEENIKTPIPESEPVLTDKELNELAAKLVKAELLGNQELADELKAKLSKAREVKAKAPKDSETKEVVLLTHTDAKGFTQPVSLAASEPSGGRRKGKKVKTHAGGKRMRYFADDDKYSLQEMFQREKLNTVEDSNEVFAKLASKGIGRDDSARDMEDVFEETARVEESEGRQAARERQRAVEQSRRTARTLDHCQWCLDSRHMLKHLIVAIGTTCYLCVPPYQSLTDHHCLIVPRTHTPCATQLDEDVWAEIQDFRKALVQMFLSRDEDVVFFESARKLNQFPHMILNCVPVPKETGDMAPIYFKKAIQECEQEWSNNKKLVDLRGRDVRRAVPRGLPYFAVDFGLDSGYAHVIEDEQLFPLNFAQEIIGGMLDLDHSIWRKQRRQTFEEQSKKVIELSKLWSPFDITKKK